MNYQGQKEFLKLLDGTNIFETKAKMVIECALEQEMLPLVDYDYVFDVMKLEVNMNFILDKKAAEKLRKLQEKYDKNEK